MGIIQFQRANCKHCYKCVRICSIKSIGFKDEQARILEDECVLCGQCFLTCPQNAKYLKSELSQVKNWLKRGEKVFASIAPSFVAAFDGISISKMSMALKKLGFFGVEETAIGAGMVTAEYEKLLKSGEMENMITTCCPTVNMLIEKYFPELIIYAAPVVSPAVAHGKAIKNVYGENCKTVFIGPCISKMHEGHESGVIDATLMFDEMSEWFKEERIYFEEEDYEVAEIHGVINRLYPIPGGILKTISEESKKNYKTIEIDGIDRCIQMLESLKSDLQSHSIKGYFIEMSACPGSCVYGPALKDYNSPLLLAREKIFHHAEKKGKKDKPETESVVEQLAYEYEDKSKKNIVPSKEELNEILNSMGKYSEEMMFNCGACGYDTCREKAVAIFEGKAEIKMCVPFMWSKMESMSNLVLDNTPNAVIIVDSKFDIVEYNNAAVGMFNLYGFSREGLPLVLLFDTEFIQSEAENGNDVYDQVQTIDELGKTFEITCIKVDIGANYIIFIKDITAGMEQKAEMQKMREETLKTTQEVIDNQMRVAQEIASLLGETTGQTKVALTKLKKTISSGGDLR